MLYVYQAALYCEDCGSEMVENMDPVHDEGCSEGFPQAFYGEDSSDSPAHCDACNELLGDVSLTADGLTYVLQALIDYDGDVDVLSEWAAHFDIEVPGDFGQSYYNPTAVRVYAEEVIGDNADALASFDDAYAGEWEDSEAWARDYMESTEDMSDTALRYFDAESFVRDCGYEGMSFARVDYRTTYVFYEV